MTIYWFSTFFISPLEITSLPRENSRIYFLEFIFSHRNYLFIKDLLTVLRWARSSFISIACCGNTTNFTQENRLRNFEKPMMDSRSPPSIIFDQTLWIIVLSSKKPSLIPKIDFEISRVQVRVNGWITRSEDMRLRVRESPMIQFRLSSRY
jgi:hypothetical protein